jgi:polyhydroxyalkanoate synthesis regulator phasin
LIGLTLAAITDTEGTPSNGEVIDALSRAGKVGPIDWVTRVDAEIRVVDEALQQRLLALGSVRLVKGGRLEISARPRPCEFYKHNGCKRGSLCRFSHDEPAKRKPEAAPLADPRAKRQRRSDSETEASASSVPPPPTPTTSLLELALSVQSWQLGQHAEQARLVVQQAELSRQLAEQGRINAEQAQKLSEQAQKLAEQGRLIADIQASRQRQGHAIADLQASRERHRAQLTQVLELHQRVVALEAPQ